MEFTSGNVISVPGGEKANGSLWFGRVYPSLSLQDWAFHARRKNGHWPGLFFGNARMSWGYLLLRKRKATSGACLLFPENNERGGDHRSMSSRLALDQESITVRRECSGGQTVDGRRPHDGTSWDERSQMQNCWFDKPPIPTAMQIPSTAWASTCWFKESQEQGGHGYYFSQRKKRVYGGFIMRSFTWG